MLMSTTASALTTVTPTHTHTLKHTLRNSLLADTALGWHHLQRGPKKCMLHHPQRLQLAAETQSKLCCLIRHRFQQRASAVVAPWLQGNQVLVWWDLIVIACVCSPDSTGATLCLSFLFFQITQCHWNGSRTSCVCVWVSCCKGHKRFHQHAASQR